MRRRRCSFCTPPHWLDGQGPAARDDDIHEDLCDEARHRVAKQIRALSADERDRLLEPQVLMTTPPDVPAATPHDDGTTDGDWFSAKITGLCMAGAILVALAALIVALAK